MAVRVAARSPLLPLLLRCADPQKRITIEQIYRHPWYTKNLPPGVLEMNNQPQPAPEGIQVRRASPSVPCTRAGAVDHPPFPPVARLFVRPRRHMCVRAAHRCCARPLPAYCAQTAEEIQQIIAEARKPHGVPMGAHVSRGSADLRSARSSEGPGQPCARAPV